MAEGAQERYQGRGYWQRLEEGGKYLGNEEEKAKIVSLTQVREMIMIMNLISRLS